MSPVFCWSICEATSAYTQKALMKFLKLTVFVLTGMALQVAGESMLPEEDTRHASLENSTSEFTNLRQIVDGYVAYRENVWRMNPPMGGVEPEMSVEEAEGETWFEKAWARWMSLPYWFMAHSAGPDTLDPDLQARLWPEGHPGDIVIWEHPGQQLIHLGLTNPDNGIPEILASFSAPDWNTRKGESAEAFAKREQATRRVVWKYRSPWREPDPEPEPEPRNMMAMGGAPPQFRLVLEHADSETVSGRVEFGEETTTGPFTIWRHDSGIPNGWEQLPGLWFPVVWEHDRGTAAERDFTVHATDAGEAHPLFLRATLGLVDSDNDGMDDGWELWHFGELVNPQDVAAGDDLTNLEAYLLGADPTLDESQDPSLRENFTYDDRGWLMEYEPSAGPSVTYAHDAEGNILSTHPNF